MVFSEYSDYYDLYYADKDYAAEVDFVLKLAAMFGNTPESLLDMGCGTGRHLEEFVKRGLTCDGFDLSSDMLSHAHERLAGTGVGLSQGNLVDFENGNQYDMVVSMFAVMGYLTDNDQLIAGLRTARKHLKPGGVFIFDGWFGPAVLAQGPGQRRHEYREGRNRVIRDVTPNLDPVGQTVTVHYDISVQRGDRTVKSVKEDHIMRFMFVQETGLLLEKSGLNLLSYCPFLAPDKQLGIDTWNVTFISRKQ